MSRQPYAIMAVIEQAVAEKLAAVVKSQTQVPGRLTATGGNLWQQLHGQELLPAGLDLSFLTEMSTLLPPVKGAKRPLDAFRALFTEPHAVIQKLLAADSPEAVWAVCQEAFADPLRDLCGSIRPLLAGQLSILVSLATTAATLPTMAGPAIEDALLRYFFSPRGYETVDGMQIAAPVHLADIDLQGLGQLRALATDRGGERYVRDLVRVMVEAADDVRYGDLKRRYGALLALLGDDDRRRKCASWFKGFASMAEAAVTASVEEACLGIAAFQTNALIAASAGTFAGTAARKAAQHVFLSELEHLRLLA